MDEAIRNLADLYSHPGFQQLLKLLEQYKNSILGRMAGVMSDRKLAHLARCYQIANDYHVIMSSETTGAWAAFQAAVEQGLVDQEGNPKDPYVSSDEAWQARFKFDPWLDPLGKPEES